MFYEPTHCGGCELPLDRIEPDTFGSQLVPYSVVPRSFGGVLSLSPTVTMYLCNSCRGIVERAGTFVLDPVTQYHVSIYPLAPRRYTWGNLQEAQKYRQQSDMANTLSYSLNQKRKP